MKLECIWLEYSVSQRKRELERGENITGTMGYEKMGCYECDGQKKECNFYNEKRMELEK